MSIESCKCGQAKSRAPSGTFGFSSNIPINEKTLEPTDVFGKVTFTKKGQKVETGCPNFAARFAFPETIDEQAMFWPHVDVLLCSLLNMESPDIIISLHDEGKFAEDGCDRIFPVKGPPQVQGDQPQMQLPYSSD